MPVERKEELESGVYEAEFVSVNPQMVTVEGWHSPKLSCEFKTKDGLKAFWSADIGPDLFRMIRSLTGQSLPTNLFQQDNNTAFRAGLQALQGFSYSGLVRVNWKGYIDQLALYPGSYTWRFVSIDTRTKDTSVACQYAKKPDKHGKITNFVRWSAEIVTGQRAGHFHTQMMNLPGYSIKSNGNLCDISSKSQMSQWLTGILGPLENDPEFVYEPDCDNIWPLLEWFAQRAAKEGLLFTANACDISPLNAEKKKNWNAGNIDWRTIIQAHPSTISGDILPITVWDGSSTSQPAPVQASPQSDPSTNDRVNGQVVVQLNAIAQKLGLDGEFTGEVRDNGTAEDFDIAAWSVLYPGLVEPVCAILPLPSPYGWPPLSPTDMNWGEDAATQFVEVLLHFANMPDEKLATFIGEGTFFAMNQELQDVFVSPKPIAAAAKMDAAPAPAAAAMMGGIKSQNDDDIGGGEVEKDAIPF